MQIDEIEIVPVKPRQGHIGFCSFVYEGLYLSGIAIYTRPQGGYRLVFPTKQAGVAERTLFYPINKELGRIFEEEVGHAFEKVMNTNARHHCVNI